MKLSNLTSYACLVLSLIMITNTIHCMEPIEPRKTTQKKKSRMKRFANRIGIILLGKNKETVEEILFTEFADLPSDIQNYIMSLLTINSSATTLREAAQTINTLAQVNAELNTKINSPQFTVQIIEYLAQKFNVSPEETATALATKEAQDYLSRQLTDKNFLSLQYPKLSNKNINVNVTDEHGNTPLIIATTHLYQNAIDALLANENINISMQNNNGDTPLHIVLTTMQHHNNAHKTTTATNIASMLLDHGAHTEIKNKAHISANDLLEKIEDQQAREILQKHLINSAMNRLGL